MLSLTPTEALAAIRGLASNAAPHCVNIDSIDRIIAQVATGPAFSLDSVLMEAPAGSGYRLDVVAEPQYAVVASEYFNNILGLYGFKVGFPINLWNHFILPDADKLLAGPVTLFGMTLQCTGWFARIAPSVPIRSTDQLVWLNFQIPAHAACHKGPNNLTCAPGVAQLLAGREVPRA